jgi:hypothetical protein
MHVSLRTIDELLPPERLSQQLLGAQAFRFRFGLGIRKCGNHQHRDRRMHSPEFRQEIETAFPGHSAVAHNQVEISSLHGLQGKVDVRSAFDHVSFAFEDFLD